MDADGRADITTWDPESRIWSSVGSTTGQTVVDHDVGSADGSLLEIPIPGRYYFPHPLHPFTQRRTATRRVFFSCPPQGPCAWRAYLGNGMHATVLQTWGGFGQMGDVPLPIDLDGKGVVEPAFYRPVHRTLPPNHDTQDPDADSWRIRTRTTFISVFQQGRHEGELVVPTCGAERRGFVAPVRRVRVRGRFPTDRDIDVPPNLFHHYQALGEDTVSVMVLGAGVCDGGAIRPACTATVRDQTILVEADMCCESRPVTSLYASVQEPHLPPSVHAEGQLRIDVETREEGPIRP
jgi:hypothetical protein